MKFRLIEGLSEYIAIIHIDDEDGTWVKIDAPSPKAAVGFLVDEMKKQHPDANYIRVSIDNEVQTWERDIQLDSPEQKYSSAATSINSAKLPAVFNLVDFEEGTLNLDYGGGKFDNATQALAERGVSNLIYDPFNRSKEHNDDVIKTVRQHGGADSITCSNVLNVIAEQEVRLAVIGNIKKLLKPSGVAYFTVYEGNGTGVGAESPKGYQLNKKTRDYVEEIAMVFPREKIQPRGKLSLLDCEVSTMIFNRRVGFPYKVIYKEDLCEKYLDDEQQFWDYGTQEITSPTDIIDTTKTGFSAVDEYLTKSGADYHLSEHNRKGEIVMMSPEEYFKECADHAWVNSKNTATSLKISRRADKETLEHIKTVLTKYKKKLCMPYIDYASPGQEGLHRMMVIGDMFGWDFKVPVLVITIADTQEEQRRIKLRNEWNIKQHVEKACNKAFCYSYQDIDEFKDQLQWELDRAFQYDDEISKPVKFDVALADEILTVTVNGVSCEYHESSIDLSDKSEDDAPSDIEFDITEDDLDDIDILLNKL